MDNLELTDAERVAASRVLQYQEDYSVYARDCQKIQDGKLKQGGGLVPFVFNRAQRRVWEIVKEKMERNEPVRIFLLKARQLGMTTFAVGFGDWLFSTRPHRSGVIVSHEKPHAHKVLTMADLMWKNKPPEFRPMRKTSNRNEMRFANPRYPEDGSDNPGLESVVTVATAENRNFGIGGTLHFAILSEFARYPEVNADISTTMKTFRQAVPRAPGTFVFYETTARGFNLAKEVWDDEKNGIEKIFLSWVADEDYTEEEPLDEADLFDDPRSAYGDELTARKHVIRELKFWYPEFADSHTWLQYESLKRLRWRRVQIDQEFDGDPQLFRQEHPLYPEEAFLTSGVSVFPTTLLSERRQALSNDPPATELYRWNETAGSFGMSFRGGDLAVYETPEPGAHYVIGADVGEGLDDSDWSAAQVLKLPRAKQVAALRMLVPPDEYAYVLKALAVLYNKAHIGVEVTGTGLATQLKLTNDIHYSRVYRRQAFDSGRRKHVNKVGFSMNRGSKPVAIADLRKGLRSGLIELYDITTILELLGYVKLDKSGKMGAVEGNDDMVTSLAVAIQMRQQVLNRFADARPEHGLTPHPNSLRSVEAMIDRQLEQDNSWTGSRDVGYTGM